MKRRRRPLKYLFLSIFSLVGLIGLLFFVPPSYQLPLAILQLPIVVPFFIVVALFCFSAVTYIFKSRKHGILFSLFVVSYLLLRLSGFTHPLFFLLLLGIFLTFEMVFTTKPR
jgi:hypothetical protein